MLLSAADERSNARDEELAGGETVATTALLFTMLVVPAPYETVATL
ncbi:MAG: hypothetical protein ACJ8MH_00670 [Povalibacter sp.]